MIKIMKYKQDKGEIENRLLKRSQLDYGNVQESVRQIIHDVRENGDAALTKYTQEFDHVNLSPGDWKVTEAEFNKAYDMVDKRLLDVIRKSAENIRSFHEKQLRKSWMDVKDGIVLGQMNLPIEKVGVYVPGGTAAYPSSVLMNIIPAKVAGVEKVVMVTPPGPQGEIYHLTLVSALEAGVDEVYKIGGAQAIAALSFGTESIPKVDKIVGPGNIYVALAKREVFGFVGIDMVAGPSEILVIGDESANPDYVAADLLSQAEHDPLATVIFITNVPILAYEVNKKLKIQASQMSRYHIIEESIRNYGTIVIVEDLREGIELANQIAPEHLELAVDQPFEFLGMIRNAGAVFLGHYTPEALGDYFAGPNHVLPTNGTARFFSPLSVVDFIKKTSVLYYSKETLASVSEDVMLFAHAEGLDAHSNSINIRCNVLKKERNGE
ncbi:MAG: histidinol dehydrogenase [Clostridia bacterium]|jgi:histidinol dehydrogenase